MNNNLRFRLIYFFSFVVIFNSLGFKSRWIEHASFSAPISIFKLFPGFLSVEYFIPLFLLTSISLLMACLRPEVRIFRGLCAILFLCYVAFENSFSGISHSNLALSGILLLLAIPKKKEQFGKWISVSQVYLLTTYFCAGLWKLRTLLHQVDIGIFSKMHLILPAQILTSVKEQSAGTERIFYFFLNHPTLSTLLWLGIIGVELSYIIPIFFPKWRSVFGFGIVGIHTIACLLVWTTFMPVLLVCFPLFYVEKGENCEKN